MKHHLNKAFLYPVLRNDSSDYPEDTFSMQPVIQRSAGSTGVNLEAKFDCSNEDLLNLVENRLAEFVLLISSPLTFFRTAITSTCDAVEKQFLNGELFGTVELAPFLLANSKIKDFNSNSWNIDYAQSRFDIQPGSVLAIGERHSIFLDLAEESSVASIFRLVEDSNLADGSWSCDIDSNEDQVSIRLSPSDLHRVNPVRVNAYTNDANESLLNGVYFPALVWLLQEIDKEVGNGDTNQFEERRWFRSLQQKLEDMNCQKLGQGSDRLKDAQIIFEYPFRKLPLQINE